MKKLLCLFVLGALLHTSSATAQDVYSSSGKPLNKQETNVKSDKLIDPSRFIVGGWFVFGMGNGFFNAGLTPVFGYRITDNFSAGIGFGYQYFRIKENNLVITDPNTGAQEFRPLNANIYSPSVWTRYVIWNNIFAHVEYEHNIFNQTYYDNDFTQYGTVPVVKVKESINVPSLLVGGGLRQPISDRTSFIIMGLYDVLQEKNSPYRNTLAIRLGINVGF